MQRLEKEVSKHPRGEAAGVFAVGRKVALGWYLRVYKACDILCVGKG